MDFLSKLLDTSDFQPRWYYGNWPTELGWLHISADLAIWGAYVAIPVIVGLYVLRRKDVPFPTVFWLFVAFILACGLTHLMAAVLFWWPAYRLDGLIKIVTAAVSWITVVALLCVVPKALSLRGVTELEREVSERMRVEEALRVASHRTAVILESIRDAFVTIDREWRFTYFNTHAERYFGRPKETMLGRVVWDVFPQVQGTLYETEFRRVAAGGGPARFEAISPITGHWVEVNAYPSEEGLSVYFQIIDDRKRAEEELLQANDRLEERVAERTAELEAANKQLRAEILVRQHAESARIDMLRRLATAQEHERRRLSRDLHDTVGQTLTGLTLAVEAVSATLLSAAAAERLGQVRRLAGTLARELHDVAVRLRPTTLDDLGLAAALGQLINDWSARTGVPVEFEATGLDADRLPAEVETTFYRVVQEALTNIARYAHATRVSVVISRSDKLATAVVEDDGVGFDPETAGAGRLGLLGMRERVALVGGELHVESSPGAGTTVIARVPVEDDRR